jgi:hypothetical protein
VLHIDPDREPDRARQALDSHLARAKWMTREGYQTCFDAAGLALTSGGFGLSFNAMNATDVRTELGSRFDAATLVDGKPLVLYGRVAWAHDFVSNPALSAVFQTLPGTNLTVLGAPIAHDSALTTAEAQLFLTPNRVTARPVRR